MGSLKFTCIVLRRGCCRVTAGRRGERVLRATAAANHLVGQLIPLYHRGKMGGRSGGSDRPAGGPFLMKDCCKNGKLLTPDRCSNFVDHHTKRKIDVESSRMLRPHFTRHELEKENRRAWQQMKMIKDQGEAYVRFKAEVTPPLPLADEVEGRAATGRPRARPSRRGEGGGGRKWHGVERLIRRRNMLHVCRSVTSRPTHFSAGTMENERKRATGSLLAVDTNPEHQGSFEFNQTRSW